MVAGVALAGQVAGGPNAVAGTTTITTPGATTVFTSSTGTTTMTLPGSTDTFITPDPPSAPHLLRVFAGENGSLVLEWEVPASNGSPLTSYKIYRGTTSGGEALLDEIGTASNGKTAFYVDHQPVGGTTYFYEVAAVNSYGESARSNELSAVAGQPDPPD